MANEFRIQAKAMLMTWQGLEDGQSGPLQYDFDVIKEWLINHDCKCFSVCEEKAARRHYHAYIEYHEKVNKKKHQYAINGAEPHDVQINRATKYHYRACAEGHFYVYCKYKNTHVQSFTNCSSVPTCRAIYNLCREQKMSPSDAVDCATEYRMVEGINAMKRDVDSLIQQEKRKWHEEYIAECQKKAKSVITRPFKSIPAVTQWYLQYIHFRDRYDFLLLVGPSKMGKTQYAKHLLPEAKVFELSTNWREFDPRVHKGIIFDDVSQFEDDSKSIFQYIMNNKPLFQACASEITLGKSKTGIYEYSVCVYKQPIIVCCNFDHFESRAGWIDSNACIVKVTEPLFC